MLFVGIDEAGYGPRLGPFVLSAVSFFFPEKKYIDFWQLLKKIVSKNIRKDFLTVFDSKKVYNHRGNNYSWQKLHPAYLNLEQSVLVFYFLFKKRFPRTAEEYLRECSQRDLEDLSKKMPWYAKVAEFSFKRNKKYEKLAKRLVQECEDLNLRDFQIKLRLVFAEELNHKLEKYKSKMLVWYREYEALFEQIRKKVPTEDILFFCGKLGATRNYLPYLGKSSFWKNFQEKKEEKELSSYLFKKGKRKVKITFIENGEEKNFLIALASLFSKFTREIMMFGLNTYWREKIFPFYPTAGYPKDAERFISQLKKSGFQKEAELIWRSK